MSKYNPTKEEIKENYELAKKGLPLKIPLRYLPSLKKSYLNRSLDYDLIIGYTNSKGNRKRILKIIGNKCLKCSSKKIEIHHEKYFKITQSKKPFPPELIEMIKKYLFPLCKKHHSELHKYKRQIKKNQI